MADRARSFAATLARAVLGVVWVASTVAGVEPASAQQVAAAAPPATAAPELTEVVVTGSRIVLPNMASASPIQVLTQKDIQVSGRNDISDIVMQLPQNFNNAFSDFNGRTSGLTTAGGLATADLRGLGPQRTLVLVNGRRLGAADPNTSNPNPAPDLDQIPVALVERVDVVTGGASAVYGSDAIAGVINFIMKRNFQGVQLDGQFGTNWHSEHSSAAQKLMTDAGYTPPTGTIWDGHNRNFSITLGTNFDDDKGNVTGYFGYLQADPVASGDRDFGGCQLVATTDASGNYTGSQCSGSSNSNFFQPNSAGPKYSVSGNRLVPWGTPGTTPPAIFNSQPYIYVGRDDLRYNAGFIGHIDINDHVKPYAEFSFMNDRTDQVIAPSALFKQQNPLDPTLNQNYNVNCDNPFLSGQEAGILCSPAQLAYVAANPGQPCQFTTTQTPAGPQVSSPNCANVNIGRRNVEGGGREAYFEHTNMRGVVGAKGEIASNWTYDVYGQYYYTQLFTANRKYLNFQSITNALQVTGTAANPVCISGPPCVPYNIFSDGGVTPGALNYLYINGTSYGTTAQRIAHADITGDLGQYGIKSPWASDGVSVNFGYEHRSESMDYDPDSAEGSGLLSGFGGAPATIHKSLHVEEEFIEIGGALVQDKPGVKNLTADLGFRRSDYSTSGSVNTGKIELQWQPIEDFRLRGSFERAIRAPNLLDLYLPAAVGNITSGDDPCSPNEITGVIAATLQQCLRTLPAGWTPGQVAAFKAAYLAGNIPQGTGSQLSAAPAGNPNLHPERANTFNVGVTISPQAIPELTGSIDYYQIKLSDEITAIPPALLLQQCLATGDPFFCSRIIRSPNTFGLTSGDVTQGGYIDQTVLNIAEQTLKGIDVQGHYLLKFSNGWGALGMAMNGAYLLKSETQPYPGSPSYDCAGLFGSVCQTVNPHWRHTFRMTWASPWNLDVSATWRFMSSVKLDNNDSNPLLFGRTFVNQVTGGPGINYLNARIGSYSYLDLAATYFVTKGIEVRAGINNVLDKDPPLLTSEIVGGGSPNTYETYDTLGRQLFIAFTAKF